MFVPTVWRRSWARPSPVSPVHRPGEAGDVGVRRRRRRAGHAVGAARADRHQYPQRLLSALAAASAGIRASRFALLLAGAVGYAGDPLLPARALVRPDLRQLDGRADPVDAPWAGWCWPTSTCSSGSGSTSTSSAAGPGQSVCGDVNWVGVGAFVIGLVAGWLFSSAGGAPPGLRVQNLLNGADLSLAGRPSWSPVALFLVGMRAGRRLQRGGWRRHHRGSSPRRLLAGT